MKIKAYEQAYDAVDSGWGWFTDDEGRAWGVVDGGRAAGARAPMVEAALKAADAAPVGIEDGMGWFLDREYADLVYAVEKFVGVTGAKWPVPSWRETRKAAHAAVRAAEGDDVETIAAALLAAATGVAWARKTLRGYNKCVTLFIPADEVTREFVREVEARLFNDGTGFDLYDESGDCVGSEFVWEADEEAQLRRVVADGRAEPVELEIYRFGGYRHLPIYTLNGREVAA